MKKEITVQGKKLYLYVNEELLMRAHLGAVGINSTEPIVDLSNGTIGYTIALSDDGINIEILDTDFVVENNIKKVSLSEVDNYEYIHESLLPELKIPYYILNEHEYSKDEESEFFYINEIPTVDIYFRNYLNDKDDMDEVDRIYIQGNTLQERIDFVLNNLLSGEDNLLLK